MAHSCVRCAGRSGSDVPNVYTDCASQSSRRPGSPSRSPSNQAAHAHFLSRYRSIRRRAN